MVGRTFLADSKDAYSMLHSYLHTKSRRINVVRHDAKNGMADPYKPPTDLHAQTIKLLRTCVRIRFYAHAHITHSSPPALREINGSKVWFTDGFAENVKHPVVPKLKIKTTPSPSHPSLHPTTFFCLNEKHSNQPSRTLAKILSR